MNASFYRFPKPTTVESWAAKSPSLKWSIKVNRSITHTTKFGAKALEKWNRFRAIFKPLEPNIDFFLFQLSPTLTPDSAQRIGEFFKKTGLKSRFALEPRNKEWFSKDNLKWASELGLTWVSVDSPDFPRDIFCTRGNVYLRMHGRTGWYSHKYSSEELDDVAERIIQAEPEKAYVFFNNDHNMLENARAMLEILRRKRRYNQSNRLLP